MLQALLFFSGISKSFLVNFGKSGFLEKGSFQKSPFSRDSRDFRESREPQTVENKGESDHFLEVLENLEILETPVKDPFHNDPFFRSRSGNPWFAPRFPVAFVISVVAVISANPILNSLFLEVFAVFVISVVFVKGDPHANHGFGKP